METQSGFIMAWHGDAKRIGRDGLIETRSGLVKARQEIRTRTAPVLIRNGKSTY